MIVLLLGNSPCRSAFFLPPPPSFPPIMLVCVVGDRSRLFKVCLGLPRTFGQR